MEATLEQALARLAVLEQENHQLQLELQAAAAAAAQPAPAPAPVASPTVKPPKPHNYKGGKGVATWLDKVEQYFEAVNLIADAARISFAALLLEGPASTWWSNLRAGARNNAGIVLPTTWADFRTALCDRFQPVTEADLARQHMRKLAQTRGLQAYINDFQDLALKVPEMDERTKMDNFCFGLRPDCRQYVRQQRPHTLKDAITFALCFQATLVEDRAAERALGRHWNRQAHYGNQERRDSPTPMELGSAVANNDQRPRREERSGDRQTRRVFKCYACGQPGHRQFECPNRKAQNRRLRSSTNRAQVRCMEETPTDSEEEN